MVKTNHNFLQMTDAAIMDSIEHFIKRTRIDHNKTQAQLAKEAGLNRWTLSQIENGGSINLSSLIMILRALNSLHILSEFAYLEEISPFEFVKFKKQQKRQRVRNKTSNAVDKPDLGW